ncbi:lipase containing protein [Tritrichomonas foetus]|uniref:sn-1-specific diacylglycerol lipase n=1 Tax=Tritrichomonas foetus TaxID=1144522 RepID=A0A1J4KBH8_9EUKA|nr:lipase containing protein [Tritrichomonas foetus]|eukprot:OHT07044.1 lipase containing protein [Tritrichomonas foetus]
MSTDQISKDTQTDEHITLNRRNGKMKKLSLKVNSKSYVLKHFRKSLPTQTHEDECINSQLNNDEMKLAKICSELCYYSYKLKKLGRWPEVIGDPVYVSRVSAVAKIPFYISNSEKLNTIFITCRGSYCFNDIITDITGNALDFEADGETYKIHQGIYQTASYIFYQSQPVIKKLNDNFPDRKIIITGHSLGASVASATTEMYYQSMPELNVRCICFAPPPSVDYMLWINSRLHTKTFIIDGDFVPFLSVHNILKASNMILNQKLFNIFKKIVFKTLKKRSLSELRDDIIMYPPGELYLFKLDEKRINVVEILNPNYFSEIVNGLKETNHRFKNYVKVCNKFYIQNK